MTINPDKIHDVYLPPDVYFSQVTFDGKLQTELNNASANDGYICWDFNARQGFIMEKDSFKESRWFIPFTEVHDNKELYILQFNFGDLLKIPNRIVLSWEKSTIKDRAEERIRDLNTTQVNNTSRLTGDRSQHEDLPKPERRRVGLRGE